FRDLALAPRLCGAGVASYKMACAYILSGRRFGGTTMMRLRFLSGTTKRLLPAVFAVLAIFTMVVLVASDAHARAGGGFSGGSRGMRTFSAPPATRTVPNTAAPMQRSVTQPSKAGTVGQASARPGFFG